MPGRPRLPGTDAQRAAARRQQVRENVRAFRQRNRERALASQSQSQESGVASRRTSVAQIEDPARQLRLSSTPEGRSTRWILNLPLKIDMGSVYANAFITAFRDQSMPNHESQSPLSLVLISPESLSEAHIPAPEQMPVFDTNVSLPPSYVRVEIGCWKWKIAHTFEATSTECEMLREALLASSLRLLSIQNNDSDLAVQAMHIQTRALRRLREAFDVYVHHNGQEKAALLSTTAMTISMSELLLNKSWDGFSLHLQGVGALIEHSGPASLDSELARRQLKGYRTVQLPFLILNRRSTFLARSEWTNHPWRDGDSETESDGLHSLLDIGFRLPCVMEMYDRSIGRNSNASRRLLKKLDKMVSFLNEWMADFTEEYAPPLYIYSIQPALWGGLRNEALMFQDDMAANCFTSYAAIRTALFSLVCQLADDLKDEDETARPVLSTAIEECLQWSRIACQCIEYFFVSARMITGNLNCLLAFDCAWGTFITMQEKYQMNMEVELSWCRSTADKIVATGMPVYRMR